MKKNTAVKVDVHHIARLANLTLPPNQAEKFQSQFDDTLQATATIDELDTQKVSPTAQVTGQINVTREDIVTPPLSQKEALSNAKGTHNGFFVVPAIF